MSRSFFTVAAALIFSFAGTQSASAALVYSTLAGYRMFGDYYDPLQGGNPLYFTDLAIGTDVASLAYSGPGGSWIYSTFAYSGSASATPLVLRAETSVAVNSYLIGAYVGTSYQYGLGYIHAIPAGEATASVTDQIVVTGPGDFYELEFTYELAGTFERDDQHIHSWPLTDYELMPRVAINGIYGQDSAQQLFNSEGLVDNFGKQTLTVLANSNVPYELTQSLRLATVIADQYYSTDNDPFQDGDFDPSHIASTNVIVAEHPYNGRFSVDFGHSMVLKSVIIRDLFGNVATDASLVSQNGVIYPDASSVPEPSTFVLLTFAAAGWCVRRRRAA